MSVHLINLVENQVDLTRSEDFDSIAIAGLDISNVKRAIVGTGIFYFYSGIGKQASWLAELSVLHETPRTPTSMGPFWTRIDLDKEVRFPCSGIIASFEQGYLIAPSLKIEVTSGKNIAMMFFSPRTTPYEVSVDKNVLSIPNEGADLTVSNEAGQLRCMGTISGSKFKAAKLELNRNPHLPAFRAGYNEELATLTGPGAISAAWSPVARNFSECVFIFYPSTIKSSEFKTLATWLGAPDDDVFKPYSATVVGDGQGTDYKIRLVLYRGLRRSLTDEIRIRVS